MSQPDTIWTNGEGPLPEEKLLAYLEGRLTPGGQREVEAWLSDEGAEADALEGLQALGAEETRKMTSAINAKLQKSLAGKRRKRRGMDAQKWTMVAVGVVLMLAVICFVMLWWMKRGRG